MSVAQVLRVGSLTHPAENMEAAVQSFLGYCESKNLSDNTINYYCYRLQAFQHYMDSNAPGLAPKDVTRYMIREFLIQERKQNSPSTANHSLITVRAFFNYLVREEFLTEAPTVGVEKARSKKRIIETFAIEQIESILTTCKKDFTGVRDKALILTLFDCGLRVSELCGLDLGDISWNDQTMIVLGKGDKERCVPFGQATRQALIEYSIRRGDLDTSRFFVTCYGCPLDRFRAREIIIDRCKEAGIAGVRCSPHTFRHTFAVSYLRSGGDVFSLQRLLGHSDLAMTRRYCEMSQTDIVEKHKQFSPADRLRPIKVVKGRKRIA